ncbi:hypothetical protein [Frankia sp. CiP3]|uniref:hypothetical protein n=1 Tax=Frankia sp. CiP3 TaxID=2880971 RepID=UPI001EF61F18|nr:hypothetical protein [Frankia sp. CiP3]
MTACDPESLAETLAILSDATTVRRLAESEEELARGEIVTDEELATAIAARQSSSLWPCVATH